ncbi:MAG: energy-coupling factor ABC transporter permease [Bacteroides sp.]|nr:energy-coupling factor ABC transporter permease [Bacteroides sp.]
MHIADALISPTVAVAMDILSASLMVVAVRQVKHSRTEGIVPLMGALGAFVLAAQMVNFAIPGTGSSGHLIGGVLLSALLGPWAALLVLSSVVIVQCLLFADGGLLALGCNVFNMAVCSCLIAYPLVFRPLMRPTASWARLLTVCMLTSIVGLELGAFMVTAETALSGVSALTFSRFLLFMLPIHLPIAVGEGLATAALLAFVQRYRPEMLMAGQPPVRRRSLWMVVGVALLIALGAWWGASSLPDGLEWSIEKTLE